jgi:RHS repeat-associated protein
LFFFTLKPPLDSLQNGSCFYAHYLLQKTVSLIIRKLNMACPAHTYYPIFEPQKKRFKKELTSQKTTLKARSGYFYGFNGKETDAETDLQDYGMRIYNPSLGRFLSVDPISASYPMLTPYQFASNTPIQAIDLDGLEAMVSYITTNADGSTDIRVMTDSDIEDNAEVPMQNRIVVNGTELTTAYGSMGVPFLDANMQNVRMTDDGHLAYDTPDASGNLYTVYTATAAITTTGSNGTPVSHISFKADLHTNGTVGSIPMTIPFDGSVTPPATAGTPVNLTVPANADSGSAKLNARLDDFAVANTTIVTVTSPARTPGGVGAVSTTNMVGTGGVTPVNVTIPVAAGDNINLTTPQVDSRDYYNLTGNLQYTVTPR